MAKPSLLEIILHPVVYQMELLFVFALLFIILYYFYKKKPKNHYPVIQYQDHKKHVLNYKKIQTMNTPIKDLQYVYLLSFIDDLPQDKSILIYLLLKKWNEQKDISLEEKDYELSIHFLKTYTNSNSIMITPLNHYTTTSK